MHVNKLRTLLKAVVDPSTRYISLAARGFYNHLPDDEYIHRMFRAKMGYQLDLEHCSTFNEKLQWLKLYDRKPFYSSIVDKYEVKKYVANIIGEEYTVPTLGVWNSFEEIDFNALPDRYVLKCTHDSGGIYIAKNKDNKSIRASRRILKRSLKKNYYYLFREWPYKYVKPRIIAEQYLEGNTRGGIIDYKIHCFNGEPQIILVCADRFSDTGLTEDFFDTKWNHLAVRRPKYKNSSSKILRPQELDEMLELSRRLSKGFLFLRVDFYVVQHRVYIGELTFFPNGGYEKFIPESFDLKLGDMLRLPRGEI